MSVWQIWGLAFSLIFLDIALISLYFSQPIMLNGSSRSDWDFRIAELRQLETKPQSGVAGVSISRNSTAMFPTPTPIPTLAPTPISTPILFETTVPSTNSPIIKPWQMPFGSLFGIQDTTRADFNGQIL